ncbi:MAG: radical SAM protein [Nitrospirae bacterium]|nr:radical SAM protein [Nitrospirota bacterium]
MRLKLLFINPWIYDFAAINLWSLPLGMYEVTKYLCRYVLSIESIDCMDTYYQKKFGTGKYRKEIVEKPECLKSIPRKYGRYGISIDEFKKRLSNCVFPDIVLVTSIMSYWYPGVQKVVEILRDFYRNIPIILGGIYATLWHKHAEEKSGADFVYRGSISEAISTAFNKFGLVLKNSKVLERQAITDKFKYAFAPVLTSMGCPFRCTYCASSLLSNEFIQLPVDKVLIEILNFASKGIRDFAFYDDALLVNSNSHIKPLLKEIISRKLNIRFHCPNGLHARAIDDELAYLMKKAGFVTLRLSLETVNTERQKNTGGKVNSMELRNAISHLKKNGFTKEHIGVYLMYGLPGQDIDEVKAGIDFIKSLDVRINLTEFSPIPGTQCWDELVRKCVITEKLDPLLTNNTVFSYLFSGYSHKEIENIKSNVKNHNAIIQT